MGTDKRKTFYKLTDTCVVRVRRSTCPEGFSPEKPISRLPVKLMTVAKEVSLAPRVDPTETERLKSEIEELKLQLATTQKQLEEQPKSPAAYQIAPLTEDAKSCLKYLDRSVSENEFYDLKRKWTGAQERIAGLKEQLVRLNDSYVSLNRKHEKQIKDLYAYDNLYSTADAIFKHLKTVCGNTLAYDVLETEMKTFDAVKVKTNIEAIRKVYRGTDFSSLVLNQVGLEANEAPRTMETGGFTA